MLFQPFNSLRRNALQLTCLSVLVGIAPHVSAGGFSEAAVPTRIDIDRGNGVMVYGAFGNPAGCTAANQIYIGITHPQYQQIYSTLLMAYASGKRVQVYAHSCKPVGWYSADSVTYNHVESYGSVSLFN